MFVLPSTCEAVAQPILVQAPPVGIRQSFVEAPPRARDAVNVPRDIRALAVGVDHPNDPLSEGKTQRHVIGRAYTARQVTYRAGRGSMSMTSITDTSVLPFEN
jgi:hypothetical protein